MSVWECGLNVSTLLCCSRAALSKFKDGEMFISEDLGTPEEGGSWLKLMAHMICNYQEYHE